MVKPTNMPPLTNLILDDASFQALFTKHFIPLCAWYQYKFGFSTDQAKEAVHIGFIKLWENRDTIAPGIPVKAWLRKTITNTCLDMLKHEKIKHNYATAAIRAAASDTASPGFENFDYKRLAADIQDAISAMPAQMRTVFEYSRNEGLKYAEIAARLNISVKTVETQMSRALARLRQELAHYLVLLLVFFLRV